MMMNTRSFFSFVAVTLLLLSRRGGEFATLVQAEEGLQVFGGQIIEFDEFKWFAAIRLLEENVFLCGGALIGARYVITALHCVEEFPDASVIVQVGYYCRNTRNCFRDDYFSGVTRYYKHEGGGDFVMLMLDKFIPIQPAVPYLGELVHPPQSFTKNKNKGRKLVMVGAGQAGNSEDISFYATKLDVTYLAPEECRTRLNNPSLVSDFDVCSIPMSGNPCFGDSGSALVVSGKRRFAGRDIVMAVHKFGARDCEEAGVGRPSGHFRLADASSLIRRVVCEGDYPENWCPTEVEATVLQKLTGHSGSIAFGALSFNSDSTRLLSGGFDDLAKIWDVGVGDDDGVTSFANEGVWVQAVQYHPLYNFFATGSQDASVKLWTTNMTEEPLQVFQGHTGSILSVAWNPSGTRLASSSADTTIKIWSTAIASGEVATLTGHTGEVNSVDFHPGGTQLVSASEDGTIRLWEATTSNSFHVVDTLRKHNSSVLTALYSPDGQFLASGAEDNTARVWKVDTRKVVHDFREHTDLVRAVAWSPDGRLLATGSADGSVRVWDALNGGRSLLVLSHEDYGNSIFGLEWSPDGTLLASGMGGWRSRGEIVIWKISGRREIETTTACYPW